MADNPTPDVVVTAPAGGNMDPSLFVQADPITAGIQNISTVDPSTLFNDVTNNTPSSFGDFGSISSPAGGGGGGLDSLNPFGGGIKGLAGAAGDLIGGIGSFMSSQDSAKGDQAEAAAYTKAAALATENEAYSKESTALQQTQAQREIYKTLGAQQAQVAAAGFGAGGSAQELLRSSQSQGALTQQVISVQGHINSNAYQAQADAYTGQAQAATAAASAAKSSGTMGLISGIAGAAFSLFSDIELKQDFRYDGVYHNGLCRYIFSFIADPSVRYRGVLAQEVRLRFPEAVHVDEATGYLKVDYAALGIEMEVA